MQNRQLVRLGCLVIFLCVQTILWSKTARYRCMWRDEPSTTMIIGWDQISGTGPVLKYDIKDHGQNVSAYPNTLNPSYSVVAKGMNNHFIRLSHLTPNTTYYFIIQDSEGVSQRMSFQTTPDNPNLKLSIIAGGDSRNHRQARVDGNRIVSKLRPHFVLFGGDMTAGDTPNEWIEWFDDWQYTIGSDGRLTPILVTRGNHEASNASLVQLFDVAQPDLYYALTFGGNLLRVYTLNTLIPSGGSQRIWLEKDLSANQRISWRIAQYHHTIRPHTKSKPERDELLLNWATLFHKYKLKLVVESDAHVVKWTYPIRPSRAPGSQMGFIRDDESGTVYVGEGCWGAPLRENNDNKSWTRNSGSFNQFKWIFVDRNTIEVRTVHIQDSQNVQEVNHQNIFQKPAGLSLWQPSNGEVVRILQNKTGNSEPSEEIVASGPAVEILNCIAKQNGQDVIISWSVKNDAVGVNYQVQRSIDGGRQFTTIADYRGEMAGESKYQCPDLDIGKRYALKSLKYRIQYIDKEGKPIWKTPKLTLAPSGSPRTNTSLPPIVSIPLDEKGKLKVSYNLPNPGQVEMILMTLELKEVSRVKFDNEPIGVGQKILDISRAPEGNYLLIVKASSKVLSRFKVVK